MCGVVGLIGESHAGTKMYPALFSLQHRGQDAAGILSYDFEEQEFHLEKGPGLVSDVFGPKELEPLRGSMAIGHTRYSTVGRMNKEDFQPMLLSHPYGIGMIHNGNVTNYQEVVNGLRNKKNRWTFTRNDLEILMQSFSEAILSRPQLMQEDKNFAESLSQAVHQVLDQVEGAFSCVGLLAEKGLFAFCDPRGIRPLLMGRKRLADAQGEKYSYCVASELQVFHVLGYEYWRDVNAGEFIYIDRDLQFHSFTLTQQTARPCMFEWVYFAGAESTWHGRPVYEARLELGRVLAEVCRGVDADLIAPVPDTSRAAASSLAETLGIPYREVLIKNRYVQRSFIMNQQGDRNQVVALKLSPVESEIRGKKILLVDDSIVRGTTAARMVQLLRDRGAEKVYLASTCPPIRHPCYYGIDFPTSKELLAHDRNVENMADILGVDGLFFLPLEKLKAALGVGPLCMACLDNDYPVPVKKEEFLKSRQSNLKTNGKEAL